MLMSDIWNEGNGVCDICMLPDCPGISECGVLNKIEADVVRFNQYAEMFNAPKLPSDNAYPKEVRLLSMKTTYFLTHESINCPICGKLLQESKSYDEVACSDPQCRFNDSHSLDEFISTVGRLLE